MYSATTSAELSQIINLLKPSPFYFDINFWNLIILAITAIIILWYTIETKKLREEAQKTNKYSFRPIIVIKSISPYVANSWTVKINNIGKGPALNIESRICELNSEGKYKRMRELLPNEKFNNLEEKSGHTISGITSINKLLNEKKFTIFFTYEDSARFKYQTMVVVEVFNRNPTVRKTVTAELISDKLVQID